MSCNTGFDLETFSSQSGQPQRASSLVQPRHDQLRDRRNVQYHRYSRSFTARAPASPAIVNATNIVNPGTINMGYDSLLSLQAENIDLTRGTLAMENSGFNGQRQLTSSSMAAVFDGYWGLGIGHDVYPNGMHPDSLYGSTPPHSVPSCHQPQLHRHGQQLGGTSFCVLLVGCHRSVRLQPHRPRRVPEQHQPRDNRQCLSR